MQRWNVPMNVILCGRRDFFASARIIRREGKNGVASEHPAVSPGRAGGFRAELADGVGFSADSSAEPGLLRHAVAKGEARRTRARRRIGGFGTRLARAVFERRR